MAELCVTSISTKGEPSLLCSETSVDDADNDISLVYLTFSSTGFIQCAPY